MCHTSTAHGKGHTNAKKINHVICSGGILAKIRYFVVVVKIGMQHTTNTNTNTRKQTAKVAYY